MRQKYDESCPDCEGEAQGPISASRTYQVKGEQVTVPVTFFRCPDCDLELYADDSDPLDLAYREYRRRHNWTQPEELTELVDSLEWDKATISRLKKGALQSESQETALKLARKN